jgi:hypothetical protein
VDVILEPPRAGARSVALAWDRFPLPLEDEIYYVGVIRPAVVARLREVLELVGTVVVVA